MSASAYYPQCWHASDYLRHVQLPKEARGPLEAEAVSVSQVYQITWV